MANNNVQNVRFLRNGTLFTSRQAGLNALTGFTLTAEMDGSSILARYQEGTDPIKTLVGYVYYKDASNKSITIFDVDDAGSDVDEKIKTAIEALDAEIASTNGKNVQVKVTEEDGKIKAVNITTDNTVNSGDVDTAITDAINKLEYTGVTTGEGVYVTNVTETDGIIAATTATLPTVGAISEAGKPIIAVSESLGKISATAGTINAEFVSIADSGNNFTASTVEDALAEIADEIDAMDKNASAVEGQVVTTVSEVDGKVSETKANVKDLQLGGYSKSSSTGAIASTDTINEALSKLENKAAAITVTPKDKSIVVETTGATTEVGVNIRSGERVLKLDTDATSGGVYTALDLVKTTEGLPAEIKERYQFKASDGSVIGANIDIPKDSHIVSINYIKTGEHAQNLEYVYIDVSGKTQTTYVDMSELVLEAEFASGVTATDHVVHGVVDSTSEKDSSNNSFLTVGADGFKINGINGEITTKINALSATVSGESTDKKVNVKVTETNGKITAVDVVGTDIASAQGLATEITNRTNADTELSNRLGASVTTTNTASAQLSALSGTSADASGVTSVYGAKAYAKDYTDEKVTSVVDGLDADVSGNSTHVTVGVKEEGGKITAVTVSESNIASASDLTAEIAARKAVDGQSGQEYAKNANANYISGATSLNDADVKLDAALKVADDAMLTGVTAGNGIDIAAKANKSQTISAKVKNDGGIVNDGEGLHLGTIDCGTY